MTSNAYVFTKRKLEVNIKLCRETIIALKSRFVNIFSLFVDNW